MILKYYMRAFKITAPTGYVDWISNNSPDNTGVYSGYSVSDLTNITINKIEESNNTVFLSNLRSISPNSSVNVYIDGYSSTGDGGEGTFYWDSASTSTDNNGTIIKPTGNTTGRWKRQFSGPVNVRWFGAKGNGVTNDTAAIQAALDSLSQQGGEIILPPGIYYLSTPIILNKDNHQSITISGIGWGRSITPPSSVILKCASSAIVYNGDLNNVLYGFELKNIFVLGDGSTHDHLLKFNGLYTAKFTNVNTNGAASGKDGMQLCNFANIQLDNYSTSGIDGYGLNLTVEGALTNSSTTLYWKGGYVKNCKQAGLYSVGSNQMTDITIEAVLFESCGRDGSLVPISGAWGCGIILDGAENVTINAYFEANILFDVLIGGNVSGAGPTYGINDFSVGVGCKSVVIRGAFEGQSGGLTPTIEGCKIVKCDGIFISGFYSGYSSSLIAISESSTATPSNYRIKGLQFGACSATSIPATFVRDGYNRLDPALNPSGMIFNGLHPDYRGEWTGNNIANTGYYLPSFYKKYIINSFASDGYAKLELPRTRYDGNEITIINNTSKPIIPIYLSANSEYVTIPPYAQQSFTYCDSTSAWTVEDISKPTIEIYPREDGGDDWINLASYMSRYAGKKAIVMKPGIWRCKSTIQSILGTAGIPSNTTILGNSGVKIICELTFTGTVTNGPFTAEPIGSGSSDYLNSRNTINTNTISTIGNAGGAIAIGAIIQIDGYGTEEFRNLTYTVKNISGTGPYTVTLDRPAKMSWQKGTPVGVLTSVPTNINIDLGDGYISGTCDRFIELVSAQYCSIKNVKLYPQAGTDMTASFDIGGYHNLYENVICVVESGTRTSGLSAESNEKITERGCYCSGCSIFGFTLYDCVDFLLENCYADSTNVGFACLGDSNNYGCNNGILLNCGAMLNAQIGCWLVNGSSNVHIIGGNYSNNTQQNIYVYDGYNNTISDAVCINGTAANIQIDSGAYGTKVTNVDISTAGTYGLIVGNAATLSGIYMVGSGVAMNLTAAGTVSLSNSTLASSSGGIVRVQTGCKLFVSSSTFTMPTAGDSAQIYVYSGGTAFVQNCTFGTGTGYGVYAASGGTAHVLTKSNNVEGSCTATGGSGTIDAY